MMKKIKKKKAMSKQEKVLAVVFVLLLVLVVVLSVVAMRMKNDINNAKASIVIPILDTNSESEISVDLSQIEGTEKEYIFKVSNYKDNNINEDILLYNVEINKPDNVSIKMYKDYSKQDLLENDKLVLLENKLLLGKKKEDIYRLIITLDSKPSDGDKINIKISS